MSFLAIRSQSLCVDDDELFDWLDDILSDEHDLEVGLSRQPEGGPYDLLLPYDVPTEQIETIIADLDVNEVKRIWKLNNPRRWFRKRRITRP